MTDSSEPEDVRWCEAYEVKPSSRTGRCEVCGMVRCCWEPRT